MHIPDGFLTPPVWIALDAAAAAAVAVCARRAQSEIDVTAGARIPMLGVTGAFVFAAQMINFPIAPGTSGHLVGSALLTIVVGPWAAAIVMTAVLLLQALILQDGGILALGANIFNMAIVGVLAAYVPMQLLGRATRAGYFLAGVCGVFTSAAFAMAELSASGIAFSRTAWTASAILFLLNGVIEGAITVAAVNAIRRVNPPIERVRSQAIPRRFVSVPVFVLGTVLVLGLLLGLAVASQAPDVLEAALAGRGAFLAPFNMGQWSRKALSGLLGMLLVWISVALLGRRWGRRRPA